MHAPLPVAPPDTVQVQGPPPLEEPLEEPPELPVPLELPPLDPPLLLPLELVEPLELVVPLELPLLEPELPVGKPESLISGDGLELETHATTAAPSEPMMKSKSAFREAMDSPLRAQARRGSPKIAGKISFRPR